MKAFFLFVLIAAALMGWRYTPPGVQTAIRRFLRTNLLLVALAGGVTVALLAFSFLTQGKIL